jgi:pimeloyl-ACP methyl ester carboxylesterase
MGRPRRQESASPDPLPPHRRPGPARRHRGRTGALVAAAAALGATALYTRYQAQEAEWRHPPMGGFLNIDGLDLHYVERGEGPDLVLLHGNGAMVEDFALSGVLDLAAEGYRTVAFDRPGFGHSPRPRDRDWSPQAQAEVLRAAFARLGLSRPILVGHSWGTLVALALALDHPDEVGGLVLMSGYYFPTSRPDFALFATPALPVLGDVMRYTLSPALGRALAPKLVGKLFEPRPVPERFALGFPIDMALRPWQIRATAEDTALLNPTAASMCRRYGEVRVPTVIMAGSDDRIVDPARHSARLHAEIGPSELRLVPGCGHMFHYDAPGRVIEAVDAVAAGAVPD